MNHVNHVPEKILQQIWKDAGKNSPLAKSSPFDVVAKFNPTSSEVHVDAVLSNMSVAMLQSTDNFAAYKIFPKIPSEKQRDLFYTYDDADFMRNEMTNRAPLTESEGVGFNLSTDSYHCEKYGLHVDVSDETYTNMDSPIIDVNADITRILTQMSLIKQEILWADQFFTTGVWGTDIVGDDVAGSGTAARWSLDSSTPIEDIEAGRRAMMLAANGTEPNTLVLAYNTWSHLKNNPQILDRIRTTNSSGTQAAKATLQTVAEVFEIDRIVISKAVYNTAAEGATQSNAFIANNNALLCYVTPTPGKLIASAGYTFDWTGLPGGVTTQGVPTVSISDYRMELVKGNRLESELAFTYKRIKAAMGYFFSAIVSDADAAAEVTEPTV